MIVMIVVGGVLSSKLFKIYQTVQIFLNTALCLASITTRGVPVIMFGQKINHSDFDDLTVFYPSMISNFSIVR